MSFLGEVHVAVLENLKKILYFSQFSPELFIYYKFQPMSPGFVDQFQSILAYLKRNEGPCPLPWAENRENAILFSLQQSAELGILW